MGDDAMPCSTPYYGRRIHSKAAEGARRDADALNTKKEKSDGNKRAEESAYRSESAYYGRNIYSKIYSNVEEEEQEVVVVKDGDDKTQAPYPFYGRKIYSKIEETCPNDQAPSRVSKSLLGGIKQSGRLGNASRSSKCASRERESFVEERR